MAAWITVLCLALLIIFSVSSEPSLDCLNLNATHTAEKVFKSNCVRLASPKNDFVLTVTSDNLEEFKQWILNVEQIGQIQVVFKNPADNKSSNYPESRMTTKSAEEANQFESQQPKRRSTRETYENKLKIKDYVQLENMTIWIEEGIDTIIEDNPILENLRLIHSGYEYPSGNNTISIQRNPKLKKLHIDVFNFVFKELKIGQNDVLDELDFSKANRFATETTEIIGNKALKSIVFKNNQTKYFLAHEQMIISNNRQLEFIKFPKFDDGWTKSMRLEKFILSSNPNLKQLRLPQKFRQPGNSELTQGGVATITYSSKVWTPQLGLQLSKLFNSVHTEKAEACLASNPITNLETLNSCKFVDGDLTVTSETAGAANCTISEIRGNLSIGNLELGQLQCLNKTVKKGEIICSPSNPVTNWTKLSQCTVVDGDLQLDESLTSSAACNLREIRGRLFLGRLVKENVPCLKNTHVFGNIYCISPGTIVNYDTLAHCNIIEGDITISKDDLIGLGHEPTTVKEIRGKLIIKMGSAGFVENLKKANQTSNKFCKLLHSLTEWKTLDNCEILDGNLQLAEKILGSPSTKCSIIGIRGNISLGNWQFSKLGDCLQKAQLNGTISCRPTGLIAKWESLNNCTIVEGDLRLAENITGEQDWMISEIRGNLELGRVEIKKSKCLQNARVRGDISCIPSNPLKSWNQLRDCNFVKGDLILAANVSGETPCSIREIRGDLSLGTLEMTSFGCLKKVLITGDILCKRQKSVTNWANLNRCTIVEGSLQLAMRNSDKPPGCTTNEIRGNLTLGKLAIDTVECLFDAKIKERISSSNCDFKYSYFSNFTSHSPIIPCHLPSTEDEENEEESGELEGDEPFEAQREKPYIELVIGIVIAGLAIFLAIIGGIVFFLWLRIKRNNEEMEREVATLKTQSESTNESSSSKSQSSKIIEEEQSSCKINHLKKTIIQFLRNKTSPRQI